MWVIDRTEGNYGLFTREVAHPGSEERTANGHGKERGGNKWERTFLLPARQKMVHFLQQGLLFS
jgi:hypothetical protein